MPAPNLNNTKVLVAVFAMSGCGACEDYLPRFTAAIEKYKGYGLPFYIWESGPIAPGWIPVLVCDAASQDPAMQEFANKLNITATPSTVIMTRNGTRKVDGSIDDDELDGLLRSAVDYNY